MNIVKKSKLFMIISLSVLVITIIVSGTYALYKAQLSKNIGVNTTTHGLAYYINYVKGTDITAATLNPSTSYEGGASSDIEFWKKDDSYDIYGKIELTVNTIGTNLKNSAALKYAVVNNGNVLSTGSLKGTTSGSKVTILKNLYLEQTKQIYTVYVWLDNSEELGNISNESLSISVDCTASLQKEPTAADTIISLYTSAAKVTATNNSITYNTAPSVSLMNDRLGGTTTSLDGGNIRYYGASPNNYIYFNCSDYSNQTSSTCETWRIIGVFDGKLKLIKSESIGAYSWDNKDTSTGAENDTGKNDWTTARLMKLLNPSNYYKVDSNDNNLGQSLYYNSASGKCYSGQNNATVDCDFTSTGIKNAETRNMIAETTYNLGGWNSNSVYSNQIYEYERGTTVYSGRPTTWKGKIALAYPSDYGYAADLNQCKDKTLYDYDNRTCTSNNWMKAIITNNGSNTGWLLTPRSGSSSIEEMQGLKDRTNAEIEELEQKIESINADIQQAKASIPEAQNVEAMIASDRTCIDIKNEIVELENQLKVDAKIVDVSELQSEKRTLNEAVQGLYKRLANREQIGRAEKEIASLEEKRIANNQKLADLEKWEFTALQFQKDKDAELLKRINGMFRYVSFSFVNEQLNGGEKLTCVCTVNGTPFLDVNNAGQINAGIDIINAICTAKGVSAPIFVDNAESVNQIIPSLSQIIRLVVTTDKELTIK